MFELCLNLVIGIRASLKCSAPHKPTMFSKECMFSCQMPSRDHSFLPLFRAGQNGAICHHDIVVCKNASVRELPWHAMAISCSPMIPMHPDATSSPTLSKDIQRPKRPGYSTEPHWPVDPQAVALATSGSLACESPGNRRRHGKSRFCCLLGSQRHPRPFSPSSILFNF